MSKTVKRILLFSDPHRSMDSKIEEEKWFPPVCNFLVRIGNPFNLLARFLSFWDRMTRKSFLRMLEKAKGEAPYDLAIGLGDYTPGTNESGLITQKSRLEFLSFKEELDRHVVCPKKLVWGDHCAGYRFKVIVKIGTEKGGLSKESVTYASELIGPPFGFFEAGPARFIFISTNLIRNVDEDSPLELQELRDDQENFLARKLHESRSPLNFLLLHDPTALGKETSVRKIMDSHRQKITAIFHGHLHAEVSAFFTRLSPVYGGLCREYKTILVPASWGMMGIGGGFKILNIYEDGSYDIEKHKI